MNNKQILNELREIKRRCQVLINKIENNGDDITFMSTRPVSRAELELATLRNFIDGKVGNFRCDLLTASDMLETIQDSRYEHLLKTDVSNFTSVKIGRMFTKLCNENIGKMTASSPSGSIRLCIIRNAIRYNTISMKQVYDEYQVQIKACREEVE